MKYIIIFVVLLIIVVIMGITINAMNHPCIKSHPVTVHHAAYTSYMPHKVGKTTIQTPEYHPAYDSKDTVCDKYK